MKAYFTFILLVLPFLPNPDKNAAIPPFCGFNAKQGFYSNSKEMVFDAIEAKLGHSSGIPDVVKEIMDKLDVPVDIGVYIVKGTGNCSATIAQGGRRIMIADHDFLASVNKEAKTDWAAISIIAHEVGHHISGFGRYTNPLRAELDADYWSGFILQKLGASREAAIKCMEKYGTETNTESHPNKQARIESIREGYDDGKNGKMDLKKCQSCER